jgi:hypothetical protein
MAEINVALNFLDEAGLAGARLHSVASPPS